MHPEDNRLRRKVLFLTERDFLSCFESVETGFPHRREPGSVNQLLRVRLVGVPPDATVRNMWYDHARMAVGILVTHPSFPELPVGADPEVIFVERTLYQCDGEGKLLAVRDQATYEPIDEPVAEPEGPVPARYTYLWRNKFLCTDTGSFDEFLGRLEAAVQALKDWKARGVRLETGYGIRDDYAWFYTENPALARELGFVAEDEDDEPLPLSEREATPGEASVCEQIAQAHEAAKRKTLEDAIEECRHPKPPAEPVAFDGAIKTESWRDRPALL